MKEASGELNMTVITVLAIAAVAAFFTIFILPSLTGNLSRGSKCAAAVSCSACSNKSQSCTYYPVDKQGNSIGQGEPITCPCEDK